MPRSVGPRPVPPRVVVDAVVAAVASGSESTPSTSWEGIETRGLEAVVANEQCALWLFRKLKQGGLLATVEPEFASWLEKRARRIVATNQLVDAERDRLVQILSDRGIPFVLLKGAARRLIGDEHPLADARAMVDVDVLLPPDRLQSTWDALTRAGYSRTSAVNTTPDDWVHLPPISSGSGIGVELHDRTQKNISAEESWERMSRNMREVVVNGVTSFVPSTTELFWHSLYHALYHGADGFKLRHLLDGVSILGAEDLDLEVVERRILADEAGCRPHGARAWMDCALWLREGGVGEVRGRYGLKRMLQWSLIVYRNASFAGRHAERIIGEARRTEMGVPSASYVRGSGPILRARRFLGAAAVSTAYRVWRTRHPR